MKTTFIATALFAAIFTNAQAANVSGVSITVAEDRCVTVSYSLDADAVVTLDIATNGVSVGGEALSRLTGDVYARIGTGAHTAQWRPEGEFASATLSVSVTAWPTDDPPDYMVVDLNTNSTNRIRWYPSADHLPGGLLANRDYRTTRLVMRKIPARGVTWTMGGTTEAQSSSANEAAHTVTFADNYYIGVFELTQRQWKTVAGTARPWPSFFSSDHQVRDMRPVENVCYNELRSYAIPNTSSQEVTGSAANVSADYLYPNAPHPSSFLGRLRAFFGGAIAFDLPSEAQWEWACRAGNGLGKWGDGSAITSIDNDANLSRMARYKWTTANHSQDAADMDANSGLENGTAEVGSYAPNAWGLYDMHGNVEEWCLDFFAGDISALGGTVNANGTKLVTSPEANGGTRVARGGWWAYPAHPQRSGKRDSAWPNVRRGNNATQTYGIRLCCPASLN